MERILKLYMKDLDSSQLCYLLWRDAVTNCLPVIVEVIGVESKAYNKVLSQINPILSPFHFPLFTHRLGPSCSVTSVKSHC